MKKSTLLAILMLFFCSSMFAQFEAGNCFISGYSNLGLDIGKNKSKSGGTTSDNYSYAEFYVNAQAGKFLADNLMAGAFLDIDLDHTKSASNDNTDNYISFVIGPVARYYFLQDCKLNPYGALRVGFGISHDKSTNGESTNKYSETYLTFNPAVGSTYFLTEKLGLDFMVGYDYDNWTRKTNNDGSGSKSSNSSDKYSSIWSSMEANLGLVFIFGK
jgi:hypothetical protein